MLKFYYLYETYTQPSIFFLKNYFYLNIFILFWFLFFIEFTGAIKYNRICYMVGGYIYYTSWIFTYILFFSWNILYLLLGMFINELFYRYIMQFITKSRLFKENNYCLQDWYIEQLIDITKWENNHKKKLPKLFEKKKMFKTILLKIKLFFYSYYVLLPDFIRFPVEYLFFYITDAFFNYSICLSKFSIFFINIPYILLKFSNIFFFPYIFYFYIINIYVIFKFFKNLNYKNYFLKNRAIPIKNLFRILIFFIYYYLICMYKAYLFFDYFLLAIAIVYFWLNVIIIVMLLHYYFRIGQIKKTREGVFKFREKIRKRICLIY